MLKFLLIISLLFSGDVFAQRGKKKKSNKRSASAASKVKSGKSNKRSASAASKMGGTKVRGSRKRQASSSASTNNVRPSNFSNNDVSDVNEANEANETQVNNFSSSDIEELKNLISANSDSISAIQSKISVLEEFENIKSRLVALEEFKNNFSVTTTSSSEPDVNSSLSEKKEEGYIKGSTELCQGKDYCSVALNAEIEGHEGGGTCYTFYYDEEKGWRPRRNIQGFITKNAENIALSSWTSDKPDLFVMKDFSYYIKDNNKEELGKRNKNIALCGKSYGKITDLGANGVDVSILDSKIDLFFPKILSEKSSIYKPFTSPDGDMVLFRKGDNKPVIRYNYEKDLLEYLPQMSSEEISALYYSVVTSFIGKEENIGTSKSLNLQQGLYEVELAGPGGSASGNCFANWGQKGGNGGLLKTTFINDLEKQSVNFIVGKAGSAGGKNCGKASAGSNTEVKIGLNTYIAKAGGAGSGKHGLKKNSKASDAGCSITEGCTVGGGAKGGGLGAALKAGNKGADGWIKIRGIPLKINVWGEAID